MYETCVECGAEDAPEGALYCESCDYPIDAPLSECSVCGYEFDPDEDGGEYDTCGPCLEACEDGSLTWNT